MAKSVAERDSIKPSGALAALCNAPGLSEVARAPRLVAALSWATLQTYTRAVTQPVLQRLPGALVRIVAGSATGFAVITATFFAASAAGLNVFEASCGVAGAVIVVATFMRVAAATGAVRLVIRQKSVQRFQIGRLESLLHPRRGQILILMIGLLLGLQFGIIHFNSETLDLDDRSVAGQMLISVDNLCYGACLDLFELYGLSLTEPVEHTRNSAPVFLAFRTAFDVVVVFLVYLAIRRREMKAIVKRFPVHDGPDVALLVEWIDRMLIDRDAWQQQFPHEMAFLLMIQRYLEGNDAEFRETAADWPTLPIDDAVRDLFVSADGAAMLTA